MEPKNWKLLQFKVEKLFNVKTVEIPFFFFSQSGLEEAQIDEKDEYNNLSWIRAKFCLWMMMMMKLSVECTRCDSMVYSHSSMTFRVQFQVRMRQASKNFATIIMQKDRFAKSEYILLLYNRKIIDGVGGKVLRHWNDEPHEIHRLLWI